MPKKNEIMALSKSEVQISREAPALLASIRPEWQAKNLIARVKRLVEVDPGSACQRLLNAAIHDLRDKIVIAGLDIAAQAADSNKLPPVGKPEDIENYSSKNTLELAYRMGLLSRSEYRKLSRCYEIRRDLEHEDDEYEAGIEDIIYIFKTSIDVVLSRDPIHLVRVQDFKEMVELPSAGTPSEALLEDFEQAPQLRQEEIGKFLISMALDKSKADLVQQNAYNALKQIAPLFHAPARASLGSHLQTQVGRQMNDRQARVAAASGLMPYIRNAAKVGFFQSVLKGMEKVGTDSKSYAEHGDILSAFQEYGGLDACPAEQRQPILRWLVVTYIGTSGGVTSYGNVRHVFYSNSAAPYIKALISDSMLDLTDDFENLREDATISRRLNDKHIARRFEELFDLTGDAD